ncbi:Endonuclease/exonuclease/phosphatase [Scleroderma yunnanense]
MSNYRLSPQQLAIAEEKRLKRQAKKLNQRGNAEDPNQKLQHLVRPWVSLPNPMDGQACVVKVMTWNILAQCLVRSELFPTSGKARKAGERERMIHSEIVASTADIICLQEVDRLDRLLPVLESAGYSHSYAAGPLKPHGCLIAFKRDAFRNINEKVIQYDNIEVREDTAGVSLEARIASTHRTKNIGFLVALERVAPERKGYIVATTHLFWHPASVQQAGILLRETITWRDSILLQDWSCIIAGDFNFTPDDPAYSLLVGNALSAEQKHRLDASRVVHVSIDPTVLTTMKSEPEEGAEEADPDRVIRNSRVAKPTDGLLSDSELSELFPCSLRSAYDEGQRSLRTLISPGDVATFGDRMSFPVERLGAHEPMWTSYTHFWQSTLDYIFFIDPPQNKTEVTGYLQAHRLEDVASGLPRLHVCGSDHFSLCAQLSTLSLCPDRE